MGRQEDKYTENHVNELTNRQMVESISLCNRQRQEDKQLNKDKQMVTKNQLSRQTKRQTDKHSNRQSEDRKQTRTDRKSIS